MPLLRENTLRLPEIIQDALDLNASDIHMVPGSPIMFRIDGRVRPVDDNPVTEADIYVLLENYLSSYTRQKYDERKSYDISLGLDNIRVRLHFYESLQGACVSCRLVPLVPKTMDQLAIPRILGKWMDNRGIIIISGLTNMGKTTSLASMVDHINGHREEKIIILEDPAEYLHSKKKGLIVQREVGLNSPSYADALRDIVREDVDTIVVGEVRNAQTMDAVFSMAESGQKVFTSVHASSVVGTIERIVNMFPLSDYERVCRRLSSTLNGVLNQWLLPKGKGGRMLAAEVFTNNDATRWLLKDGLIHQIPAYLERGTDELCSLKIYRERLEKDGLLL